MKKSFVIILLILVNIAILADGRKALRENKALEDGTVSVNNKSTAVIYGSTFAIDTTRRVPGLVNWWDYATNGQNQHAVVVLGDTVIVAVQITDSANAQVSAGRTMQYQVSYDGGLTWLSDPVLIASLPLGGAYPDVIPVMVGGSRTVVVSGRQFSPTSRGFSGVDVILGAGSVTSTLVPAPGSDYFSCWLSSTQIGGVYQSGDTLFFRKFNYVTNTYDARQLIALPSAEIDANGRKVVASSTNGQNVFAMWYKSTAGVEALSGRFSTDGGTTFGAIQTVMPSLLTVGSDQVTPWFGMDLAYKPGTSTVSAVFCTQPGGTTGAAQGWKIMYWSPSINGGTPVKIADWLNTPVLADTGFVNNSSSLIQVGMTGMSHPTVAYSADGSVIYCVFTGIQRDTTSYGFFFNDMYSSYSTNDGASWSAPVKLSMCTTDGDEIYPTLSRTGNTNTSFGLLYFNSSFPGSSSFNQTTTPTSKNYPIYTRVNPTTGGQLAIGINTISTEIPASFTLKQNYPNPFNPSTTIRFELKSNSVVTLKVFDVTGREITKVINGENIQAGIHEVNFDAGKLASGVYFYSLETPDFKDTKKMMLIK
ncbi:MAG: T9SS type A sorting domain-containing protein [Ignavibacteria bacterium]|nr:T9SS type A sorting domain-containing protein [Ignavibacteria bacterium]